MDFAVVRERGGGLNARVQIAGMPKLLRKLKVLPDAARAEIRVAMGREADGIVAMMRRLAPEKSGALRKSIGWAWGTDKIPKGAMAIATVGKGDLSITIYAGSRDKTLGPNDAYYVRFVEFGTAAHIAGGKFAGAEIPAIPAQPFFFVSWRAARKSVRAALRKASRDAARKVAAS